MIRGILRALLAPQEHHHQPPIWSRPPPTQPPSRQIPLDERPPRRRTTTDLRRCQSCRHEAWVHDIRKRDKGCDAIGCSCTAFEATT